MLTMASNKKSALLETLKNTYCRIGVSEISGVGVIAIQDIPKNVNPFRYPNGEFLEYKLILITKQELNSLPESVQKLIKDFIIIDDSQDTYAIPENGLNDMDITFYMNHSTKPNVDIVFDKKCKYATFRTNRKIKVGEELLINYKIYYNYSKN